MLHRKLSDLAAPDAADLDTPAMAAAQGAIDRAERHLRMLERLGDIAMDLAESLGRNAKAQVEEADADDAAGAAKPDPDPVAAFNKMAQTVRRTIALEARLAAGVKAAREGFIADRAARREDHVAARTKAVIYCFHDAYASECPKDQYLERVENLMEDVEETLRDAEEFRDFLDRPVGESVAKLCAIFALDPGACVLDGETWIVRRPPTSLEYQLVERAETFARPAAAALAGETPADPSDVPSHAACAQGQPPPPGAVSLGLSP
jgi:hypothetical protein